MPLIEMILPGEPKTQPEPVAEMYRITIERGDGIACSDIEARTAMSMLCIELATAQVRKPKKTRTPRGGSKSEGCAAD